MVKQKRKPVLTSKEIMVGCTYRLGYAHACEGKPARKQMTAPYYKGFKEANRRPI